MKFSYRLKRVCGGVYTNGNVVFTPDGKSLVSPVGNRLNVFDLVNQTSEALPFESGHNISLIAISHNGRFLVSIDTDGHGVFYNLPRKILLHKFHFRQRVSDLKFSPNDEYFALTYSRGVQIWRTPNSEKSFQPLSLSRTIIGASDDTTCLDWSSDSQSLIVGGRDMLVRVYYRVHSNRMAMSVLSGHRDKLIGVYFGTSREEIEDETTGEVTKAGNLEAYTVAGDGGVFTWRFDEIEVDEEEEKQKKSSKKRRQTDDSDDEEDVEEEDDDSEDSDDSDEDSESDIEDERVISERNKNKLMKVYKKELQQRRGQWVLSTRQLLREQNGYLSVCAYNSQAAILVLGYDSGIFSLYDMPSCTNIHRLSVSNCSLSTATLNVSGEWLALGAAELGQLLVWEWKSESYVLKQQGHLYGLKTLDFSSEGQLIASGGEDGKVKLWNTLSGFCTITFKDHLAPVTGVSFVKAGHGKALLTSSLDGTIRAYDLVRYKNFKTMTAPALEGTAGGNVQFTCMAADRQGELVCAGTLDPFHVYVFALQTGKLVDMLSGHEGPIACLDFCGATGRLASGSWDGTLKIWDVYQSMCVETFEHGCDVLAVAFRPDGKEVACATTNGNIYIWDVENGEQIGMIEGRRDIAGGRLSTDTMTAENSARGKFFNTLAYSADGSCILAAGRSKYACLYAVASGALVKKYQLSHNQSLEGILDKLRSDKLSDGVSLDNLNITARAGEDDDPTQGRRFTAKNGKYVPGATNSALTDGSRTVRKEVLAASLKFSPTGREWAVATTQGLQIFGLDDGILFAPLDLDIAITPQTIAAAVAEGNYARALSMALHLNERDVLQRTIESMADGNVDLLLVVQSVDGMLVKHLIQYLADALTNTRRVEFYLRWVLAVLQIHGAALQQASTNLGLAEALRALLRSLAQHEKEILKVATDNVHALRFLESQMTPELDTLKDLEEEEAAILSANTVGGEVVDGGIDDSEIPADMAGWTGSDNWASSGVWEDGDSSTALMNETSFFEKAPSPMDDDEEKPSVPPPAKRAAKKSKKN